MQGEHQGVGLFKMRAGQMFFCEQGGGLVVARNGPDFKIPFCLLHQCVRRNIELADLAIPASRRGLA